MYDTIRIKLRLPLPEDMMELTKRDFDNIVDFQTKSFDRGMCSYEVRRNRTLWLHNETHEWVPGDSKGAERNAKLAYGEKATVAYTEI